MKKPRAIAPASSSVPQRKLTAAERELVRFLAREYIRQRRERARVESAA